MHRAGVYAKDENAVIQCLNGLAVSEKLKWSSVGRGVGFEVGVERVTGVAVVSFVDIIVHLL